MGFATGVGGGMPGTYPPGSKFRGMSPPNRYFKENLCIFVNIFRFSNVSKIKWPKSEEKSEFGGRWF